MIDDDDDDDASSSTRRCSVPSWRAAGALLPSCCAKLLRIDAILGAAFCSSSGGDVVVGCITNLDVLC